VRERTQQPLAGCTTLRLGGPAGHLVEVASAAEAVAALRSEGPEALILAGGSNVVIGDAGYPGTVILLRNRGVEVSEQDGRMRLSVAAGEPWDEVVAMAVKSGWSGIECLSGIPGSAGATPIQNVGAYGQEVAETIVEVTAYDRERDEVVTIPGTACGFAYRMSMFKHQVRFAVLSVMFSLSVAPHGRPIRYEELARSLGVPVGGTAPLDEVREAVLALRARKGMVLDASDRDTYSVGSFFMNPVLDASAYAAVRERGPVGWPGADGSVKLSAAWLIEHAGFPKGYGHQGTGVAISSKHTLALTNRGGGTTEALLALAREIRDGVRDRFAVTLVPEPVLVACQL
jgi:UDP-N-acetylmuramate dehydrogenase